MKVVEDVLSRRNFVAAGAAGIATIGFIRPADAADPEPAKVISQLAKFKLKMDKEAEGVQALKDLCAAVEKNEPGVLAYICHRSTKNPEEVIFFEVYKDEDAMKEHGKTPHMAKLRTAFVTLFSPPLEVTRLDRIGGFTR
jgi:quinol monooxygenase YgiN